MRVHCTGSLARDFFLIKRIFYFSYPSILIWTFVQENNPGRCHCHCRLVMLVVLNLAVCLLVSSPGLVIVFVGLSPRVHILLCPAFLCLEI